MSTMASASLQTIRFLKVTNWPVTSSSETVTTTILLTIATSEGAIISTQRLPCHIIDGQLLIDKKIEFRLTESTSLQVEVLCEQTGREVVVRLERQQLVPGKWLELQTSDFNMSMALMLCPVPLGPTSSQINTQENDTTTSVGRNNPKYSEKLYEMLEQLERVEIDPFELPYGSKDPWKRRRKQNWNTQKHEQLDRKSRASGMSVSSLEKNLKTNFKARQNTSDPTRIQQPMAKGSTTSLKNSMHFSSRGRPSHNHQHPYMKASQHSEDRNFMLPSAMSAGSLQLNETVPLNPNHDNWHFNMNPYADQYGPYMHPHHHMPHTIPPHMVAPMPPAGYPLNYGPPGQQAPYGPMMYPAPPQYYRQADHQSNYVPPDIHQHSDYSAQHQYYPAPNRYQMKPGPMHSPYGAQPSAPIGDYGLDPYSRTGYPNGPRANRYPINYYGPKEMNYQRNQRY